MFLQCGLWVWMPLFQASQLPQPLAPNQLMLGEDWLWGVQQDCAQVGVAEQADVATLAQLPPAWFFCCCPL